MISMNDCDKEKRLKAIRNRIEFCEKKNRHKKILKILRVRYERLKNN